MRPFVKIIGIAIGMTGLLGGALLSMGHLQSAEGDFQQLELARLRNLAGSWETQLLSVRSAFRDQLLRHDVTTMVEHPAEWAGWRVENKLSGILDSWPPDAPRPRGWALLRSTGEPHAVFGDTSGLADALVNFQQPEAPDIMLSGRPTGPGRFLAMQYAPPADDQNPEPGRLLALVDPQSLFAVPTDPPAQWALMNGPKETFLASTYQSEPPIGAGTWTILLSQANGLISMDNGLPLAFCKIHVPGMQALLLVSEINAPTGAGSSVGALVLLTAGTAFLVLALRPRRKPAPEPSTQVTPVTVESEEAKAQPETVTFRQIFQAVRTPLAVVDPAGKLLRVNSAARGLLHLPKSGQPDENVSVIGSSFRGPLKEFLVVAAGPDFAGGSWLLCLNDRHYFDGEIVATRLSGATPGPGAVALEFIENRPVDAGERTGLQPVVSVLDELNPQPILLVDQAGRVTECNRAALDISSRLTEAPYLHEVLPGLEAAQVAAIVDPERAQRFESLFGSRVHDFYPVPTANGMLLYGMKKSDAQSLQIALHQAQENFNTLCAIADEAILLVDPRTHMIQESNIAASDLFGAIHPGLVGKNIETFAEWPWDEEQLRATVQIQRGDGECLVCSFQHDLIKIEGEPTLLVVVARAPELTAQSIHDLADYAENVAEQLNEQIQRAPEAPVQVSIPLGPGMLVVTNPTVRDVARRMLERLGHPCEVFTNLDDAMLWLVRADTRPEFIMLDLGDFDAPGDWLETVRARYGAVPCVGLSDTLSDELPDGPNELLGKPFELDELVTRLTNLELEATVAND